MVRVRLLRLLVPLVIGASSLSLGGCGGSLTSGPADVADAFFAAVAAGNVTVACSLTTPSLHAKWNLRSRKQSCVASLANLFGRPRRAETLKTNFARASARLVDMRGGRAIVAVVGDPGGPRHFELELIDGSHGWLVNRGGVGGH